MPKTAHLFPGQGSQFVGMGRDLTERFEAANEVFEAADAILGFSLSEIMFGDGSDGDANSEKLKQTENTQPALFVHSLAAYEVLDRHGITPDATAGHSLGEFSALSVAKAISFQQGLQLVRLRGELMARAGRERAGTMAAVLGLEDDVVSDICRNISANGDGVVEPANFNSPGQGVISGDESAVTAAMAELRASGARRVVLLPVSGAFHSPLMDSARQELGAAVEALEIEPPRCPVYLNVTARPTTDPDEIRKIMLTHLTSPVRWTDTLKQMHADETDRFLEVGAGNVLAGLVRRTLGKTVHAEAVGTAEALEALINNNGK